jgi:TPR repeat protein
MPRDRATAIAWYRKAAEQGRVHAQSALGNLLGEAGQPEEAAVWLRKAAEAGDSAAQFNLSQAYRFGHGVNTDIPQMMLWLRKAAEQGRPNAMNGLGYSIMIGFDDSYDFVEAYAWLTLAVERAPPGDAHDRAVVNLAKAKSLLDPADLPKAEARTQHLRETLPAPDSADQAAAAR